MIFHLLTERKMDMEAPNLAFVETWTEVLRDLLPKNFLTETDSFSEIISL